MANELTSIFGALTKTVGLRFDAVSKQHKQLFDRTIFEQYLDWDTPSIGLNFEELLGTYNVTIAAPTIGDNSNEPIMGTEGFKTLQAAVLNHAITIAMTIQEYRKALQLIDSKSLGDEQKAQHLTELMWGKVENVVNSVLAKLDTIFLGALSNGGVFELNDTNNPEGGARGVIDYNQPAENIATAGTQWTAANIGSVDCFDDIQAVLEAAMDKVSFAKILAAPSTIAYICRAANTRKMLHGTDKGSRLVQLADLNTYMQENGLPVFEPIRRQVRIQNGTQRTALNPWNENNLVFIPEGKLGVVKNALSGSELRPEPGVAYSNFGRIRVSQWGVGETSNSRGVEFTKAEVFAIPVITEMNGIYTLRSKTA